MVRLLFLAQFAPTNGNYVPTKNSAEEFYAQTYHLKIYELLKKYNFDFYSTNDVNYLLNHHDEFDLVWSLYNRIGFRNCEIFVQSVCEYFSLSYIGAAPNIRALLEDKSMSKNLAEHLGMVTPPWAIAGKDFPLPNIAPFDGPYFIKPRFGSGSHGIDETCICDDWRQVLKKEKEYYNQGTEIIVEKFINGILYGVPFLNTINNEPIIGTPHFQTSTNRGNLITNGQKRRSESGMVSKISIDENLNKTLKELSLKYFNQIQPCDYVRMDYIVEKNTNIPYFLEANAMMNLGELCASILSFKDIGFKSYDEIILHILNLGYAKLKK